MDNPFWPVIISLSYVYFTKVLGPQLMEKRAAFELRGLMMVYNVFQVLLHIWLFCEVGQSGFFTEANYLCQPVDHSNDPSTLRLMLTGYRYYLSKYVDMLDTLFFILRKKSNQITFLHVTHHGLVPILAYPLIRFVPGGNTVIGTVLNSLEHILMYFYYLTVVMGPRFHSFLKWKKQITTFQISQFVIVSLHSFRLFFVKCDYPIFFTYWIAGSEVIFLCLFINFYRKSYKPKTKTDALNNDNDINDNYGPNKKRNLIKKHDNNNSKNNKEIKKD